MNFRIVCVGKLKERYLRDAEGEYFKRLSRFGAVSVTELKEAPVPVGASLAEEAAAVRLEGSAILKALASVNRNNHYVIALDREGKDLSSEELADKISSLAVDGKSAVAFVIGGSLGLSGEVRNAADYALSFGRKTYPHQLMRVILAEQIYRACKISAGETYHK
ncbi:MAG: 23S rRNA (pseudouridine(1915)-N(3))-methyltransferase RlmH [Clostridiales Family XIII bacterium]|jgi:23S rRNA (pseudouridine1915-N3)-methyltransferase|nr:23S rRNA (pseudouridine(1915)-N(3))-methyltransferase RlmH [Clostridiales Family XIII bacterium]